MEIKKILKNLPVSPGIYQFFDKNEKIIYIGKSVNLKSRVNSYFSSKSKLNFAKQKMVKQITNIETILTNTEEESLILENTLIKKHKPKYNVMLKDDKNHIYIKITDEPIPQIIKTRIKPKTGTLFGPYTSTGKVNNTLKLLKKLFGYRSCRLKFYKENNKLNFVKQSSQKTPCMDYYIGRCSAPCLLQRENIDNYKNNIEKIKKFLKGDYKDVVAKLKLEMQEKSKDLKFEEALKIKQNLEAIEQLDSHQLVRDFVEGNYDIINFVNKYGEFFICVITIRDAKITGVYNYHFKNKLDDEDKINLEKFIEKKYLENLENSEKSNKKITILSPINIEISENILKKLNIKLELPQIGGKVELLKLAYKNVLEYAQKYKLKSLSTKNFTKKTMQNLLKILGYKEINKKIIFECNDISHLAGTHTVASRSVIENGHAASNLYKKFNIKTLENNKIDDFASLAEIMARRLKEIEKTGVIPDLIIIDGGKGQLSSVIKIIESEKKLHKNNKEFLENLNKLQLVSIAKREEELFLPGESESILLNKDSSELMLTQRLRDEAHRFAITFNRDKRIKSMKKNILEEIPGIGPVSRKKILKKYGSVEKLKGVNQDGLKKILSISQIQALEDHGLL
ncbi:MAG: excinuclease ABC subunit UvrC [Candidatus Gracilibacteria bacterium]|nr:excinuclease ABC subunit UvrC [Candidatus Gracilibacteria bacterium]